MQHEISKDAYNRLTSTPDAKGRKIEVIKVPVPYPLFRTHKEANGVHVSSLLLVYQLSAENINLCLFALRPLCSALWSPGTQNITLLLTLDQGFRVHDTGQSAVSVCVVTLCKNTVGQSQHIHLQLAGMRLAHVL